MAFELTILASVFRTHRRQIRITVQGCSGKNYVVRFQGVHAIESESPEGMNYLYKQLDVTFS